MGMKRTAGPARKPAAARVASRVKLATTKPGKSRPSKKASPSKTSPPADQPCASLRPDKARAAAARKATMAATTHDVDDEPIVIDEHDDTAKAGLSRQRARRTSARRKNEPSPRLKRTAVERIDDPPPATGSLLIERVARAIERELSLIEVIVGGSHLKPQQRTEAERRARTLASLARTLGEVTRLRASEQKVKPADDDAVPRDLDEFRRALSRRLEQLVAAPAATSAGEHE
jgi:hypothetical protein